MKFAPVTGSDALFCIWPTRVQDYEIFVKEERRDWPKPDFKQEPTHPAVNVSWEDARAFCAWLTAKECKEGILDNKQHYRLPADLEWSRAVGLESETGRTPKERHENTEGVYPWGTRWPPPPGAGNYNKTLRVDAFEHTSPVGSFKQNQYGLYDLGGNVWEWCEDWFDDEQKYRVLRGGSWSSDDARLLLSSFRFSFYPSLRRSRNGLRVVLAGAGGVC
jgi:formylglycine-generating enzyme required for sulfatase activity